METYSALIGANGAVELHSVAQIGLYLAIVVDPCHAEGYDAVGFDHSLHNFRFLKLGVVVIDLLN